MGMDIFENRVCVFFCALVTEHGNFLGGEVEWHCKRSTVARGCESNGEADEASLRAECSMHAVCDIWQSVSRGFSTARV